jgi:hypothetical protein
MAKPYGRAIKAAIAPPPKSPASSFQLYRKRSNRKAYTCVSSKAQRQDKVGSDRAIAATDRVMANYAKRKIAIWAIAIFRLLNSPNQAL